MISLAPFCQARHVDPRTQELADRLVSQLVAEQYGGEAPAEYIGEVEDAIYATVVEALKATSVEKLPDWLEAREVAKRESIGSRSW